MATVNTSRLATARAGELRRLITSPENRAFAAGVLRSMTLDSVWSNEIIRNIDSGHVDIRGTLSLLAREFKPTSYLEVGVRRGFSMGIVVSRCPSVTAYGFDLWMPGYGGVENPGPQHIRGEMRRLGHVGTLRLVTGNSHETLPSVLGNRPIRLKQRLKCLLAATLRPRTFDLITIDGDHSLLGAYQDLMDAMPYCSVGGAIVFDDISPDVEALGADVIKQELSADPHGWLDLRGLWRAIQPKFSNFAFFEYCESPPGVGIAFRLA